MGLLKLILAVSFHFLPSEFSFPFLLTYNLSPFLTPPSLLNISLILGGQGPFPTYLLSLDNLILST